MATGTSSIMVAAVVVLDRKGPLGFGSAVLAAIRDVSKPVPQRPKENNREDDYPATAPVMNQGGLAFYF